MCEHPLRISPYITCQLLFNFACTIQARSHNEANEAVASPKISKKNLPQMKNS